VNDLRVSWVVKCKAGAKCEIFAQQVKEDDQWSFRAYNIDAKHNPNNQWQPEEPSSLYCICASLADRVINQEFDGTISIMYTHDSE